ncbi:hypothetical protein BJG93_34830 (plasmid) [Paraburkholderia sprentiae WSM5005]|uniref:Uncharacterized protein n=1 Tax=Paraburkholderia sprentiae WSM5005 TaxID=754502 RepID=A0ACA8AX36_9BURK|nr:hypothetical protein [Paraburkholderia sprentiae]APA90289.1 hypothetical protein BJG93_34830 [Paraburkholderia sprentiae WSM5005]
MNKTQTFAPTGAVDVKAAEYEALKLTNDEYLNLLSCGHPGGTISVAQAGAQFVVAGADMRQLRDAYTDADAAALLANSNVRFIKPD